MVKKILLLIVFILITIFQSMAEWVENYKDRNICISTQYVENRGIYFDVYSNEDVNYEIEMYDILGRKVIEKKVEFSTNFNKNIPKGLYCLRIHKQDGVINRLISVN